MTIPHGRRFWKMSGSGNDFVFFDARSVAPAPWDSPEAIQRLCAPGTGVAADGVVFIQDDANEAFRIRYFNRDGSLAELCGNASLCSTRLATELGIAPAGDFRFLTDAGVMSARIRGGQPEIDLQPVRELKTDAGIALEPGERQIGFANTGVPHLVVLVDDTSVVDVESRGRTLRYHSAVLPEGANVNFAGRGPDGGWKIRTYERGVEGETLACGTGAVATGVILEAWGLSGLETALETRSGGVLTVTTGRNGSDIKPSLRGEGRVVFVGELAEL